MILTPIIGEVPPTVSAYVLKGTTNSRDMVKIVYKTVRNALLTNLFYFLLLCNYDFISFFNKSLDDIKIHEELNIQIIINAILYQLIPKYILWRTLNVSEDRRQIFIDTNLIPFHMA